MFMLRKMTTQPDAAGAGKLGDADLGGSLQQSSKYVRNGHIDACSVDYGSSRRQKRSFREARNETLDVES